MPQLNIGALQAVADRLNPLGINYAFTGGAVVNLLLNDPDMGPARPTVDASRRDFSGHVIHGVRLLMDASEFREAPPGFLRSDVASQSRLPSAEIVRFPEIVPEMVFSARSG